MAERLQPVLSRIDALKRQLYDALTNPRDYASMLGGRIQESGQAAKQLQSQAFADPRQPFKVTNEAALRQLTDMMMAGPLGFAPAGITAYHGSPYLFKQFDPMKVGTGEGAQAYGVGAGYTAEARPVAEDYARNISRSKFIADAKQSSQSGAYTTEVSQLQQMIGDLPLQDYYTKLELQANRLPIKQSEDAYAKLDIVEQLGLGSNIPAVKEYAKEMGYSNAVQNWIEKELSKKYKPAGYLYKGDIPDEILPKFLDWDKPIKDQPEVLKLISPDALGLSYTKLSNGNHAFVTSDGKPLGILQKGGTRESFESRWMENLTSKSGSDLYGNLSQSIPSGGAKASEALSAAGVRGIRYLDQKSRSEGKGTSNFIPFRPEDFKIQEINDIPLEEYIAKGLLSP